MNLKVFKKIFFWFSCVFFSLFIFFGFKFYPIFLDKNPFLSFKIYDYFLKNEKLDPSDFFSEYDLICILGPYDSFRDVRFKKFLTQNMIDKAESAFIFSGSNQSDNGLFLIGFLGENVAFSYGSSFFDVVPLVEKDSNSKDCAQRSVKLYKKKLSKPTAYGAYKSHYFELVEEL